MFRLSESDYRKLEPIALKVYRGSAKSAHVSQLMESRVGRRALVDMMFLEEGILDRLKELNPKKYNKQLQKMSPEELQVEKTSVKILLKLIDEVEEERKGASPKGQKSQKPATPATPAEKESFFTKVKNFFAKIYNWLKKIFNKGWEKIKSFFTWLYSLFFKEAKLKSPRWLNIAIAVIVVIALGYFLFGTEAGEKVRSFILNAIKGGFGAIKSAVRYVLGKSNAPQDVKDETENFLDEAAV
jgi:hypothetical protein